MKVLKSSVKITALHHFLTVYTGLHSALSKPLELPCQWMEGKVISVIRFPGDKFLCRFYCLMGPRKNYFLFAQRFFYHKYGSDIFQSFYILVLKSEVKKQKVSQKRGEKKSIKRLGTRMSLGLLTTIAEA